MSHTGPQTSGMRDPSLRSQLAENVIRLERAELPVPAVVAVAAGAVAIVCSTLVALTHGWDYRLAVLFGALIAVACASFGRRCLPAADAAGRLSLEFEAGYAAVLFCVYAADWVDWRPLGLDDAIAGLAVGLVLLVAGPARRALRDATTAPREASFALQLIAVAPAVAAVLVLVFADGIGGPGQRAFFFAGLAASLVLAWLGTVFALRRGLYGSAFLLSALSGLALFGLLAAGNVPETYAVLFGALAAAWSLLLALYLRHDAGWRADTPPETLLVSLAVALIVSVLLGVQPVAWFAAAGALATWWWGYYRRGLPLFAGRAWTRGNARSTALWVVHFGSSAVIAGACGLLFMAAATNLTGPMLLAVIGETGLYRVSDLTFSEALLADQYLWRDEPASARLVAAASPERLVRLMRTEHDRWSGAAPAAYLRAREERRPEGVGLAFDEDRADGYRVAYAYPGSPGRAAGIRRGDVIVTIDGTAFSAHEANGAALHLYRPDRPVRLGLERPDAAPREVTITSARYERPSVSMAKIIPWAGRRVGYILLHDFDRSATLGFVNAAARLREQGIDDLVLDLRMNPGGSVVVSRDIASAIGGSRLDGATFQRLVHNERYRDSDKDYAFRAPERGVLALPRLFVITSGDTCSASEAVINGLAPFIEVITIGSTTCGKPVGMTVVEYGDRAYWVITFEVRNARGEGGYYGGLRPTCPAEDDFAHELGDPEEASLKAALQYLRDGRCPDRPARAPA